jgi:hypothetical protein
VDRGSGAEGASPREFKEKTMLAICERTQLSQSGRVKQRGRATRAERRDLELLESRCLLSQTQVACVPWQNGLPHETWNGNSTILKAVIRIDQFPVSYTWSFGDGSPNQTRTVTNQDDAYKIEASHVYPNSSAGTPYTAQLTATDAGGGTAVDT